MDEWQAFGNVESAASVEYGAGNITVAYIQQFWNWIESLQMSQRKRPVYSSESLLHRIQLHESLFVF